MPQCPTHLSFLYLVLQLLFSSLLHFSFVALLFLSLSVLLIESGVYGGHLCRLANRGCKLVGCGSSVPKLQISNDDLSKMVETSDEWISDRTGIRKRRVLSGQFVSLYIKLLERLADLLFVFASMIFRKSKHYKNLRKCGKLSLLDLDHLPCLLIFCFLVSMVDLYGNQTLHVLLN